MKQTLSILIAVFLMAGIGYAAPPAVPPRPEGTAAELTAGTETSTRVWSPKILVDEFGGVAATQLDGLTDVDAEGTQHYVLTDDGDGTYTFKKLTTDNLNLSANILSTLGAANYAAAVALWESALESALSDMAIDNISQITTKPITGLSATNWRLFYSADGGVPVELALGADGTYLRSNGAAAAPSFDTPSGSGDVTAAATFDTDNVLIRSDGTSKGVQHTGISVDDSNNVSGVGTFSAGAAGFTVDADGDVTFKSSTPTKSSGVAGLSWVYEANSTDTSYIGWMGPASISESFAAQWPDAQPSGQVMSFAAPAGTGDPNGNKISAISWITPTVAADWDTWAEHPALNSANILVGNGSNQPAAVAMSGDVAIANDGATTIQANSVDAGMISTWTEAEPLPVAWMHDGTSPPDAIDDTTRDPYAYRTFASDADEDLNFVWVVPTDLSGATIQFRVYYLITNATGPTATEGVAFGLSGISVGDNDATNGTKGTVVVVTDDTLNASQHDLLITDWSGNVTITNLAAGELAECALIRDVSDTVDDYGQVVGVAFVQIRYTKNPA